jgi:hypothetical protein
MTQPSSTTHLEVEIDSGQVYIYCESPWADDTNAVLRALNDAWQSGRFVGVADGLVDLLTGTARPKWTTKSAPSPRSAPGTVCR